MKITKRIHGLLFVAGDDGLTLGELSKILTISVAQTRQAMHSLTLQLRHDEDSPVEVVCYNDKYRLITIDEMVHDVEQYAQLPIHQTLSKAAIETLAVIAYRQPITRIQIDEIRGVGSSNMLQRLMSRDLIEEIGRVEGPGRPYLYGTTDYFMNYFGLSSLDELPEISPVDLKTTSQPSELFQFDHYDFTMYDEQEISNEE